MMQEFEAAVREQEAAKNRFSGFMESEKVVLHYALNHELKNWMDSDEYNTNENLLAELQSAMREQEADHA